ncbi:UNVERIFIED_CONTAM: hypothetical protein Sindi_2581200 [Sesamum indicum]
MNLALQLGAKEIVTYTDSQLVAQKVCNLQQAFEMFELHQNPREENERADALSKFASTGFGIKHRNITLLVSKHSKNRDLPDHRELHVNQEDESLPLLKVQIPNDDWRSLIIKFLQGERFADEAQKRRMRIQSTRFTLYEAELYRRTPQRILLKCVNRDILREVHEGSCGNHCGRRALAQSPKARILLAHITSRQI